MFDLTLGPLVGLGPQVQPAADPVSGDRPGLDGLDDRAARLAAMSTVAEATTFGHFGEIAEMGVDALFGVPELDPTDSGGVDHDTPTRHGPQFSGGGGVTPLGAQ